MCGLRWADVDTGSVHIRRGLVHLGGRLVESDTKTGRDRVVELDAETIEALRRHRKTQAVERLAAATAYQDDDYVFARADGSPVRPKTLSARFQQLAREARLPVIHLHDGRHTSATLDLLAAPTSRSCPSDSATPARTSPPTSTSTCSTACSGRRPRRAALLQPRVVRDSGS